MIIEWTRTRLGLCGLVNAAEVLDFNNSSTKISSGMYLNVTSYNTCNSNTENDITTTTTTTAIPTCFSVSKSVLSTIENDIDTIIYQCMATLLNDSVVATAIVTGRKRSICYTLVSMYSFAVTVMDNDFIPTSKSTTNDISPTSLTPSDSSVSSAHGSSGPDFDNKITSHSGVTVTTAEASNPSIASSNIPNSTVYTKKAYSHLPPQ